MGTGYRIMSWQEYNHKMWLARQFNAINREHERNNRRRKKRNKYDYDSFQEYLFDIDYNPYLVGNDDLFDL